MKCSQIRALPHNREQEAALNTTLQGRGRRPVWSIRGFQDSQGYTERPCQKKQKPSKQKPQIKTATKNKEKKAANKLKTIERNEVIIKVQIGKITSQKNREKGQQNNSKFKEKVDALLARPSE